MHAVPSCLGELQARKQNILLLRCQESMTPAGPLSYVGVNPKVACKALHPSN
jgi:hypothetical protein